MATGKELYAELIDQKKKIIRTQMWMLSREYYYVDSGSQLHLDTIIRHTSRGRRVPAYGLEQSQLAESLKDRYHSGLVLFIKSARMNIYR